MSRLPNNRLAVIRPQKPSYVGSRQMTRRQRIDHAAAFQQVAPTTGAGLAATIVPVPTAIAAAIPTPATGGAALSNVAGQDVVTVEGTSSPGTSAQASRSDHTHALQPFGVAGAGAFAGSVPTPGLTAHTPGYVLLESGWTAQTGIVNLGTVTVGVWNGTAIAAAYLPTGSSSAFGIVKVDGTTITATAGVISAVSSASTVPVNFIAGCELLYDTSTAIQVNTGTVGLANGSSWTVASVITNSPTLAATTMYYVYLTSATTVSVSTTAPTLYSGTAANDLTTSHRYLGCFITDASSHIEPFQRTGDTVLYLGNIFAAPFNVSIPIASTSTSLSLSALVPATATIAMLTGIGTGSSVTMYFGTSPGVAPTSTSGSYWAGNFAASISNFDVGVVAAAFLYYNSGGSAFPAHVRGYREPR